MSKLRVYELAKELGLTNKALVDLCEQLGIEGKSSHSNTLSDDEAERIRRSVIRRAIGSNPTATRQITKDGEVVTERRLGGVIRRRKKSSEEEAAEAEALALEQTQSLDLSSVPNKEFDGEGLTADVAWDKQKRDDAFAQADALFRTKDEVPEEKVEVEEPSSMETSETPEAHSPSLESVEVQSADAVKEDATSEMSQFSQEATPARSGEFRGARVLGKIELPKREIPAPQAQAQSQAAATTEEKGAKNFGKSKEKKRVATGAVAGVEDDSADGKRKRRKQILRKDDLVDYDGDRDVWKGKRDKKSKKGGKDDVRDLHLADDAQQQFTRVVKVDGDITVGELAKQMSVKVGEVLSYLMKMGMMVTINQRVDLDTAMIVAEEFGAEIQSTGEDIEESIRTILQDRPGAEKKYRPPVITVMGHVDHGKTSLLDAIRKTAVTAGEVGGITQHIGAYTVKVPSGGVVTFLDTPGHEAFTTLRSRGASVTDIVVLVVAADDGVMPQTIEAINHAKAANVPIIVAVNKMDKQDANPDRVKQQISEYGLIPEEWGGETIIVPVSAHTKMGLDLLLENLHAQSEVLELKADYERSAVGSVIESKLDKGRGTVMTVLVQQGTLKIGDCFVAGSVSGRVRALVSDNGEAVKEAGPSIPVEVLGAPSAPSSGNDFFVTANESEARRFAEVRARRDRLKELNARRQSGGGLTLERFSQMVSDEGAKELPLVVKADVNGSVEALVSSLKQLSVDEVRVNVIHSGVGGVSETDVQLAAASKAIIVAFNVRAANTKVTELANMDGVEILYSRIIYELVERVGLAIKGMLAPVFKEKTLGRVEVRETFRVPKLGMIAGSYVTDGTIERGGLVRLLRDDRVLFEGKMASLRRFKDDVKEVNAGYECGIGIEGYSDIKQGDIIEVYKVEEVPHV